MQQDAETGATVSVDVAVLGGGLAGNLLARQLRLYVPNATVSVFERARERSWKVGEASVEIAANYLTRRQRLSNYLYERQLPKNGLRFFFDNEQKNADITEMSELGTNGLPLIPSFQLDRARLEGDLIEMNIRGGVDMHLGYAARDLVLSDTGERHTFMAVGDDGKSFPVSAKWVVDASGRSSIIAKQKQLHVPVDHDITATWARFKNVGDMDAHPNEEWRARMNHTARFLSTVHFCYPGYWIWFIPLKDGVISVGVVMERDRWKPEWRGEEGFKEFLKGHRAVWELLENAEMLDCMSFKQLAYGTKQFFSTDRWVTIGDAAAFTDPFYSPGSDFISMENDFVTDLIKRDLAGEDKAALDDRTRTYDEFMMHRFEATLLLYSHQYSHFGCYEIMRAKFLFDIASYYNVWLRPYLLDEYTDLPKLKNMLKQKDLIVSVMKEFRSVFQKVDKALSERGEYHRLNLGDWSGTFEKVVPFAQNLGKPMPQEEIDRLSAWIFSNTRSWSRQILKGGSAKTTEDLLSALPSAD